MSNKQGQQQGQQPTLLVTDDETNGPGPVPRGFQSQEAFDADTQRRQAEANPGAGKKLVPGEIGGQLADKGEEETPMTTIKTRKYIEPFRFGPKMYTVKANTPTRVPVAVKNHLIEKGLLDG